MNKKIKIIIGALGVLGLVAWLAVILNPQQGEFTLKNISGQEIVNGSINVCEQNFVVNKLEANDSKEFAFKIKADSHYAVHLEFATGKKLVKDIGYVTSGIAVNDVLLVSDNDIILQGKDEVNRK